MANTGWKSPTSYGEDYTDWTNPNLALVSADNASSEIDGDQEDYYNYSFGIPAGAIINGIEVKISAEASPPTKRIAVALSWNGGTNYTAEKQTANLSDSRVDYILGGSGDTWGRSWTDSEYSNANLRSRVANVLGSGIGLYWIQIKVYYTELIDYTMSVTVGQFVLTGIAVILSKILNLITTVGSFILTGINVEFLRPIRSIIATAGNFTLTGINVVLGRGYQIVVSVGQFVLTGIDVFLRGWTALTKNTSSWTKDAKNTSVWTKQSKNTSTWTKSTKH